MRAIFAIFNPLDPIGSAFKWLDGKLHDWFNSVASAYEDQFVHQSLVHAGGLQNYLLGNSLALAEFLSSAIFLAVATIWFLLPSWHRGLTRSLKVMVGMLFAPVVFFWGLDRLSELGSSLTEAATHLYDPPKSHHGLLFISSLDNVLTSISAFVFSLLPAGILYVIWLGIQGVMLLAFLFLLPFFALSAASERAERIANWIFAIYLVGSLLVGGIVVSCIEIGELAANKVPVGGVLWVIAMLCAAIVFVLGAIWACHKVVEHYHGKVHGRVRSWGNSKVSGKVKTEPARPKRRRSHQEAFASSILPGRRATAAKAGTATSQANGAKAATAAAGASGGTTVAIAAGAAAAEHRKKKQRRPDNTRPDFGHSHGASSATSQPNPFNAGEAGRIGRRQRREPESVSPLAAQPQKRGPHGLPEARQ